MCKRLSEIYKSKCVSSECFVGAGVYAVPTSDHFDSKSCKYIKKQAIFYNKKEVRHFILAYYTSTVSSENDEKLVVPYRLEEETTKGVAYQLL